MSSTPIFQFSLKLNENDYHYHLRTNYILSFFEIQHIYMFFAV